MEMKPIIQTISSNFEILNFKKKNKNVLKMGKITLLAS